MASLSVGDLLHPNKTSYAEGALFDIQDGIPYLRITLKNPSKRDVENIQSCTPIIRIIVGTNDGLLFFLSKFGEMDWVYAPYNVNLSPYDTPLPLTSFTQYAGLGFLLILLIDANTGIIKVLRFHDLSMDLSTNLQDLIEVQRQLPFDKYVYWERLESVYARFDIVDIVKDN